MAKLTQSQFKKLFPEINGIKNDDLKKTVSNIWIEAAAACKWEKVSDAKFNHLCPGISLVDHTRAVCLAAVGMAEAGRETLGLAYDKDSLIALCILHDVCKLLESDPDENNEAKKNRIGKALQHGFLSAYYAQQAGLPTEMVGDLIAHTRHSREVPKTIEGAILFYADTAAADISRWLAGAPTHVARIKES